MGCATLNMDSYPVKPPVHDLILLLLQNIDMTVLYNTLSAHDIIAKDPFSMIPKAYNMEAPVPSTVHLCTRKPTEYVRSVLTNEGIVFLKLNEL